MHALNVTEIALTLSFSCCGSNSAEETRPARVAENQLCIISTQRFDRHGMDQEIPIFREDIIPFWNAAVYGMSFYVLGFGLVKAALIMPLVFACVALNYGTRWVLRGAFGVLVLAVLL